MHGLVPGIGEHPLNVLHPRTAQVGHFAADHHRHEFRALHGKPRLGVALDRNDLRAGSGSRGGRRSARRAQPAYQDIRFDQRAHAAQDGARMPAGPFSMRAPSFMEQQACSWW